MKETKINNNINRVQKLPFFSNKNFEIRLEIVINIITPYLLKDKQPFFVSKFSIIQKSMFLRTFNNNKKKQVI